MKIFNVREREYNNHHRLLLQLAEFSAANDVIPLKENWSDQWYELTEDFENVLPKILNFEVRSDDVFVVTFMKCGTTWMQETAWLLMNNLDFETAKKVNQTIRSPFIDWCGIFKHLSNSVEIAEETPSPRLLKSHLPPNLLPKQIWEKKSKIIFVARNVKDTLVSSYHFMKGLGVWDGNIEEYVEDFINDELLYLPFWPRIVHFWKMRNEPNVFFVTFEEMKRDLEGVIKRLCTFLERPQLTPDEMKKVLEHLSFNKMKENKQTNITEALVDTMPAELNSKKSFEFMRRGIVGSFKDELSKYDQDRLDEWSEKTLSRYGLTEEDIFGKM